MGRLLPIELKQFDTATLTGIAQNYGSALINPAIKICFINTSTVDVLLGATGTPVSFNMRIPAGAAITLDESTLFFKGGDQEFYLPKGAQLTVTQFTAAAAGALVGHIVTRSMA